MFISKHQIALVTLTTLLVSSTPALAESSTPSASLKPRRVEERQEIRQEIKAEQEELKEKLKNQITEMRGNVAELHANRLERRFNAYYTRLTGIGTRLQTRLATLKASGKDVTSAEAKLTQSLATLASAKQKGQDAVAAFRAIDPAKFGEQKTQAFAARDLATAARNLFKTAMDELKLVTKELKALK